MKRYEMVKAHDDFNKIMNKGIKIGNKYFLIFKMKKEEYKPHFGIAVGKKIGNAVVRNKFKRQIRNIVDKHKFLFKNYYNYIIMIKKDCVDVPYNLLEENLVDLLTKGN